MAKRQNKYLIDAPLDRKDPSYAAWKLKDAQIRLHMWNSMQPQISSSLVYYTLAKPVWDQAKEMFSGFDKLHFG